jgi:hypothetical protein
MINQFKNGCIAMLMLIAIMFSNQTYAQGKYFNEIGLDFTPNLNWEESAKIEATLFYNQWKSKNESRRFRLEIDIPLFIKVSWYQYGIKGNDAIYNAQYNDAKIFIKYGIARYIGTHSSKFYYGVDFNLGYAYKRNEHLYNGFTVDSRNFKTLNTSALVGVTPFLGGKFHLSKRWILSVEAGVELNYMYERLPFYDGEKMNYTHRSSFVTSWKDYYLLNDIAFSFLF